MDNETRELLLKNRYKYGLNNEQREVFNSLVNVNDNMFITGQSRTGKSTIIDRYMRYLVEIGTEFIAYTQSFYDLHNKYKYITSKTMFWLSNNPDTVCERLRHICKELGKPENKDKRAVVIIDDIHEYEAKVINTIAGIINNINTNALRKNNPIRIIFVGDNIAFPLKWHSNYVSSISSWQVLNFKHKTLGRILSKQTKETIEMIKSMQEEVNNNVNMHKNSFASFRSKVIQKLKSVCMLEYTYRCWDIANDLKPMHIFSNQRSDIGIMLAEETLDSASTGVVDTEDWIAKCNRQALEWDERYEDTQESKHRFNETEHTYLAIDRNLYSDSNKCLPVQRELKLVIGDRVILLADGKGYKAGDIGRILDMTYKYILISISNTGDIVKVKRHTWRKIYNKEEDNKAVVSEYTQFPLQLGYGIDIEHSKGMCFDKAIIHIKNMNDYELYTVLSRVKDIRNIYIDKEY